MKRKRTNYDRLFIRLEEIQQATNDKNKSHSIMVKVGVNGEYISTFHLKDGRRKQMTFKGSEELHEYIKKNGMSDCTVIVDDIPRSFNKDDVKKFLGAMNVEELKELESVCEPYERTKTAETERNYREVLNKMGKKYGHLLIPTTIND